LITVFNIQRALVIGILQLNKFAQLNNLIAKRDIENKGKQFLINHLFKKEIIILYDSNGKPYLKDNSQKISISHSYDKIAIIINDFEETGIDIELIRDKVLKIRRKFLSIKELENAEEDVEKLLIYWGAKESLYKIYGLKELDFIKNIKIKPFIKYQAGRIEGIITNSNFNRSFELNYLKIENYIMVYVLRKI
jgi:4'-phosphopantetheinyl transferase